MASPRRPNIHTLEVPGFAPEDTLIGPDGYVYSGLRDNGTIVRLDTQSATAETIADPGGMPLGLEWLPDGQLLVCNAVHGLQRIDLHTGTITPYVQSGEKIYVCNNADVHSDGTVYVSDSTTRYPLMSYRRDIIEDTRAGRVLKVTPDGHATILMDGLSFANGVALLPDESTVLVAETAKNRIHKISLNNGNREIFAETPGLPDNISRGSDGLIWVALPSRPNPVLERLHRSPLFVRKAVATIPASLQPNAKLCCRVVAYDANGTMVHYFEGDTDVYAHVTGVREHQGTVYLGSIEQPCIAWFRIDEAQ